MKINREAFQILLAKARALSMRSSRERDVGAGRGAAAAAPCGPRRCRTSR